VVLRKAGLLGGGIVGGRKGRKGGLNTSFDNRPAKYETTSTKDPKRE